MGRRGAGLLAGGLVAALAVTAAGQEPARPTRYFITHRAIGIPVDLSQLRPTDPRPREIQLYSAYGRGEWKPGPKLALNALQDIGDGRKGFVHQADKDGGYEFGVQLFYEDGSASPKSAAEVRSYYDVVVDTVPPEVRIVATPTGVEWTAADDYLDRDYAVLQCRYTNSADWHTVPKGYKAAGSHTFPPLPAGRVLEVRVKARDQAGNDQWSRVVRVPGDAAVGASFPREPAGGGRGPFGSGAGLPQARFDHVKTRDVSVEYTVPKMGRSGVKAVRLYTLATVDGVDDPGGWSKKPTEFTVNLKPGDVKKPDPLPYKAEKDGTYGFYVAPVSGAGDAAPAPRPTDPPMLFVVVDTQAPFVEITAVRVGPGAGKGARVEIAWDAADPNLQAAPIDLEWSADPKAAEWKQIKYALANTDGPTRGRYAWDVPDENPWEFYVRARATDKAGNVGFHVWDQKRDPNGVPQGEPKAVVVDLETPEAKISGVKAGAGGSDAPPKPKPIP